MVKAVPVAGVTGALRGRIRSVSTPFGITKTRSGRGLTVRAQSATASLTQTTAEAAPSAAMLTALARSTSTSSRKRSCSVDQGSVDLEQ